MKVPIYKLDFEEWFIEAFKEGCEQILKSDALSEGSYVYSFEQGFSQLIGSQYAVAVSNGTAALETALRAIGVQGKEVIIPTNTFFATAVAVEKARGEIVLTDIEDETFSMSPASLRSKITENTGAVIVVHVGGIISKNIKEIVSICRENNVPLIEDAAHAHLSDSDGHKAGTIGDMGCFSFFPTKVMTTAEGGMVTTNNEQLYEKIKSGKNFGRAKNPLFCIDDGDNYKMTEFQGLIGFLELSRVEKRVERRTYLASIYNTHLRSDLFTPILCDGSSYYKIIVKTTLSNDAIKEYCKNNSVSLTGEVYRYPIHTQPRFMYCAKTNYPTADSFSSLHICPPLYPELTDDEVIYVCDVLNSLVRR